MKSEKKKKSNDYKSDGYIVFLYGNVEIFAKTKTEAIKLGKDAAKSDNAESFSIAPFYFGRTFAYGEQEEYDNDEVDLDD